MLKFFCPKGAWFLLLLSIFSAPTLTAFPPEDGNGNPLPSLAPILREVNPAVVNISTFANQEINNPLFNDPFFRRFFNTDPRYRPQQRRQASAGSGVIIDADAGLVVTNFHVINNADEIQVGLQDGRVIKAKLIGSDPDLDVAVLAIEADGLSAVPLSNSDKLQVGDFVLAIGNPFGLGQTVTTGIVSALGRTGLGIEGFENFIQTDASINPGNSGGALVNLRGELVGINTAILAPAGGNIGIGFAIPINMVKASLDQIVEFGEVRRGQIGVSFQDINQELRDAFNLPRGQRGVLVTGVLPDSTGEAAGLQAGDLIVSIDGSPTWSEGQLRSQLAVKAIGATVQLALIREGRERHVAVKIGDTRFIEASGTVQRMLDGLQLENAANGEGVVVREMRRDSYAAYVGLRPGDLIVGANRQRVQSIADFNQALRQSKREILLHLQRNGRYFYLVMR